MLDANFTNQFTKDTKLLQKRNKNLDKLFDILAEELSQSRGDRKGRKAVVRERTVIPSSHSVMCNK